jgi:dTDP-4-amino-4,6-dideoxygalactose transaminase
MIVPINNLQRHNHSISKEIESAIKRVLSKGWYVLGPEVEAFEAEFATYCGVEYCVGVGNGTDALELALRALEVGPGDKVATVANAGMYSTTAIMAVGAEPLYVEIDSKCMTMDPSALTASLTKQTRAIIITHLYGQIADMPSLIKVASQAGVKVIEDCAQAHGAHISNRYSGSWGSIGCFSFYPTKNLGALGDGGAIITGNEDLAKRVRKLRQYGWTSKYRSDLSGGCNSRLDEIQAAILRVKLPYLDKWNERRRIIANAYNDKFKQFNLVVPGNLDDSYVAHLYVLRIPQREKFRATLREEQIDTDIHYPIPDYRQSAVAGMYPNICLSITEKCCREVLTLPCFPEMINGEVEQVIHSVSKSMEQLVL